MMLDMNAVVGHFDILWITFDCLRYDVADAARTICLPAWEPRETPGTFTLPAHLAFFHGFLPTPPKPGPHPRLFALEFAGSLSTAVTTYGFDGVPDIITGFAALGYRDVLRGGRRLLQPTQSARRISPGFFQEAISVPDDGRRLRRESTAVQVAAALEWLRGVPQAQPGRRYSCNISATHPPHAHYCGRSGEESIESQTAALCHADSQLPPLLDAMRQRGPGFCLTMGDHGEAYGEDGRFGHRLAHPVVANGAVPPRVLSPLSCGPN
jgi:hypothetical protein